MGYKYGDKRTSYNGVFNYVINGYPKAKDLLGFYDKIPKDQQHCRYNPKGIAQFMKDFIISKGDNPSKYLNKNAQYVQNNFKSFIEYCKSNLK